MNFMKVLQKSSSSHETLSLENSSVFSLHQTCVIDVYTVVSSKN